MVSIPTDRFLDVFKGYRKRAVVSNALRPILKLPRGFLEGETNIAIYKPHFRNKLDIK